MSSKLCAAELLYVGKSLTNSTALHVYSSTEQLHLCKPRLICSLHYITINKVIVQMLMYEVELSSEDGALRSHG